MYPKKLITLAMLPVMLTACSSDQVSAVPKEPSEKVYVPSAENVKPLGRTMLTDDNMLWLTYSGSGAGFTFNGTKAVITIAGDDTASKADNTDNQARIAVYVNGERVVDDMIDNPEETYTVFESQTPQECDVKIVKLSETGNSTCAIKSLAVTTAGEITPAGKKERFIEFIGDSITCGYGVDDENRDHHFSTATEDVTKTYAYKTAENLDADYSMVSISGHGIISGYSDGKKKVANQTMPRYYDKLASSYSSFGGKKPNAYDWDFTGYTPDVIVVNLGTNDDSYTKGNEEKCNEFAQAYTEFLKTIRSHNPDSQIICTLGIMGANLYPYIESAVESYTAETGDTKVTAMRFEQQDMADGIAADWHPSEKTHAKAAGTLTAKIREIMDWQ